MDAAAQKRFARLLPALACPRCQGHLTVGTSAVQCNECKTAYPRQGEQIRFIESPHSSDSLDSLKGFLKRRLGRLFYSVGIFLIAPTYPFNFPKAVRQYVDPTQALVVDIGSGNYRIDPEIITLDLFAYPHVNVVCDLRYLPFKPGSVAAFSSRSVLEHVPNLPQVLAQLQACTRSGGWGLHLIPFLYPYHASPHDYQRLTHQGAAALFPEWQLLAQSNATGPVTLFLVILIEFLAIVGSFNGRLKAPLTLLLCLLLFPIKFLDVLFVNRPAFMSMAPSIFTVVKKP